MKMLKMGSLGKKREGFTLIELLIVMVILAILAGIVIISIGGVIGRGQATAYNADREQIEAAVAEFMTRPTDDTYNHEIGEVPITNAVGILDTAITGDDVITGQTYYTVAICPLTTSSFPQGILKQIPSTVNVSNQDNAGGAGANANAEVGVDANCVAPLLELDPDNNAGHYTWLTTRSGDVLSICTGVDCANLMWDGFQDVYP